MAGTDAPQHRGTGTLTKHHVSKDASNSLTATTTETAKFVDYVNSELVWKSGHDNDKPVFTLKTDEIVFILLVPLPRESHGNDGYLIYSLAEGETAANLTASDEDGVEKDKKNPQFKLSVLFSPQPLPEQVLREHLLDFDDQKGHFWSSLGVDQTLLDVIVSTGSGTGKAKLFYDEVLKPLLAGLALYEKGDDEAGLGDNESQSGEDGIRFGSGSDSAWLVPANRDGVGKKGQYQVTVTDSPRTVTDFAKSVKNNSPRAADGSVTNRTIILLTGDGGVIDLLNGLDKAETSSTDVSSPPPTVAILPLGTGNALFHSLHKPLYNSNGNGNGNAPSTLVLALRTLFKGTPAPLPIFRASFSPRTRLVSVEEVEKATGESVVDKTSSDDGGENQPQVAIDHLVGAIVASYGFHASLVWESDTPAYRVHGDKRFGMAAAELLKQSHWYEASVEVRKKGEEGFVKLPRDKFNYVLTTMVSNLEKTFTISPASKPLDGQLRLVTFGEVGGDRTMEIMMAAYRDGEHVGMRWEKEEGGGEDGVGYEEVEEVRVTILEEDPRWRKVCIDGTIVEIEKGGWMSVKREAEGQERIRVVVDKAVVGGR